MLTAGSGAALFAQDVPHAVVSKPESEAKALIGRWDLQVNQGGSIFPSWLEVEQSGFRTLVGRFVGTGGSARPIAKIHFDNGSFRFSIPPQWDSGDKDFLIEGTVTSNGLSGTITTSEGRAYPYTGVKAPLLRRQIAPVWGKPINLFNGKDLTGWKPMGDKNQWVVKNGILTSAGSGVNLVSEQQFDDFKLYVEFRYPKGSNSGIYLRGRYEVQIFDNTKEEHPNSHLFSGVYGFLTPSEIAASGPDTWQTYEITLIGRMVTVVANGKTVISNQEIPGITGGAIDSDEGAPGPIYFQGDHGAVEFRKVVITPAR